MLDIPWQNIDRIVYTEENLESEKLINQESWISLWKFLLDYL